MVHRMSMVVTRAPRDPKANLRVPFREDGTVFPWAMVFSGGKHVAWADDSTGLVAALTAVPNYADLSEQDKLIARIRLAISIQCSIQAGLNWEAQNSGLWEKLAEWERQVLNGIRTSQPQGFPTRDTFGHDVWSAPVPLIVVTTGYAPYTPGVPFIDGPEANLWVIDPIEEESLLDSLESAPFGLVNIFSTFDLLSD